LYNTVLNSKYKCLCAQTKSMGQDKSQVRTQAATKQKPKFSLTNSQNICFV